MDAMKNILLTIFAALLLICWNSCAPVDNPEEEDPEVVKPAPEPEPEPDVDAPLHLNVVGRYLKDAEGNIVNLHGFGQTYSPYFNEGAWGNYDVAACLDYNKRMIDQVLAAGWEMNFIRMHMDPYWSDDPNQESVRYEGHERFSEVRFRKYLDEVFVPMAEYAISKGLYVVMRPPGVSPENIQVYDTYQTFLLTVWDIVSQQKKLKNNGYVMFELANEPINIKGTDGNFGNSSDACFKNMRSYFQAVVNKIRDNGCRNIIWVPGLGYQSQYAGYANHRIEGENIGFAIHVYPGWYGSDAEVDPEENVGGIRGGGYEGFQRGWDAQIKPVADFAPIMVTEMDWAPAKYDSSWGKSITGVAGGEGFGANFKYIADNSGNVSWMIFTSQHLLAQFDGVPGTDGNYTFLNDPEACPWPVYHWFKEYAGKTAESGPEPDQDPTPSYNNLSAYKGLKNYVNRDVSPNFKLGAAIPVAEFFQKSSRYNMAVENFDEMTAENAFKHASVMRSDGTMDFTQVKRFLDEAEQAGMTVFGHTLAWHAQQTTYLNSIIKGKRVELPPSEAVDAVLLEADFNDGYSPFGGWGNNSTRTVVNGMLKVTNPSVVQNWEAQFAHDFSEPFVVDKVYKMKFRIRASGQGKLYSGFQITDGYKSAGEFPTVQFDTQWKDVELECTCTAAGGTRLIFSFGDFAGDIFIDDFSFIESAVTYTYVPLTDQEKKEVLTAEMDRWIKAMMEVTATRVSAWDAVNESISGWDHDGDGYYDLESAQWGSADNFYWQDYLGDVDYVRIVIDRARKYYKEFGGTAPLRLFINDYNLESDWDDNKKLKSLINWIKVWESDGKTTIDGIGTQMHISYYADPYTQKSKEDHIVKMLQLMADTGKLVKISEIDMGYVDKNGNTLKTTQMTSSMHREMADYYKFIVRKYFEIVPPDQQYGITHWAPVDPSSSGWRGDEPAGLWNKAYQRKVTYAGFAEGLMGNL